MSLVLIHPAPDAGWAGQRLDGVLRHALAGREVRAVRRAEELSGLEGQRLLLALPLGDTGVNLEYMRMLARLRKERADMFTTVFIGSSTTRETGGRVVTPRGYRL